MPQTTSPPTTANTAELVRTIIAKLGEDTPLTIGTTSGDSCPLPPDIAALIRQVLASLAAGRQVTVADVPDEMTPNDAAAFLNVSRMYVMKLIQEGTLPCRMVGNHHRIPSIALAAYKAAQSARSRAAMSDLYALEHEHGPVDGPPPPKAAFKDDGRGA